MTEDETVGDGITASVDMSLSKLQELVHCAEGTKRNGENGDGAVAQPLVGNEIRFHFQRFSFGHI